MSQWSDPLAELGAMPHEDLPPTYAVSTLKPRRLRRCPGESELHWFAVAELGFGRRQPTVRVADGKPGQEVQVDFGRLGLIPNPATGLRRIGFCAL